LDKLPPDDPWIPFNRPYLTGRELIYIIEAFQTYQKTSGNGEFTRRCHEFFHSRYGFNKPLLTTSCTDALELSALLAGIQAGDEVILPSYTFVSTANAFALRGARLVFADSEAATPNLDVSQLEALITPHTKAIVAVHYAGMAVDMDPLLALAEQYGLYVIEDAAQAIDATYKGRPLGGLGDLGAFSFHETKNIIAGEGGMAAVNRAGWQERAEILWEKGTNRAAFYRGEVDKYGWVDVGSSFLPSEMVAAFLWGQLEHLEAIQQRRTALWQRYAEGLAPLEQAGKLRLPQVPSYASLNGHLFYIETASIEERDRLIAYLKEQQINAVFHYLALHKSPYYHDKHDGRPLPRADHWADTLLRLPLFYQLQSSDVDRVIDRISQFYGQPNG
jgi:dTDP-4-amino-4,6-dideoxygalactose transaminase